jgi:hypothetical protein
MHVAVRSYLTAGIAAVGATAIAIAPIQPTLSELQITANHVVSVDLAAAVNPIEAWVQVIQGAVANATSLVDQVVADPAPITVALVNNQLANLTLLGNTAQSTIQSLVAAAEALPAAIQQAGQQLAAGQIVDAFNTVVLYALSSALGLIGGVGAAVQIAQNTVQNLANVIGVVPDIVLALGLGAVAPLVGTLTAGAQTIQDVVDAVGAGDIATALGVIINAPATLTGAFLNGQPNSLFPAGLLSPWQGDAFVSGPIGIALALRDEIAGALFPVGQQPQAASIQSASIQSAVQTQGPTDTEDESGPPASSVPSPRNKVANGSSRSASHAPPTTGADGASAAAAPGLATLRTDKAGQKHAGKSAHRQGQAGAAAAK